MKLEISTNENYTDPDFGFNIDIELSAYITLEKID